MKTKDIKVLFLARYAPNCFSDNPFIYDEDEGEVYKTYHKRIFEFLSGSFEKVDSICNPEVLVHNHSKYDYVFSLYNRMPFRNSEVLISSICEYYGIPYLGARPNIRALAEDKHLAKMMALYAGVKTPEWRVYSAQSKILHPGFPPPFFCKPRFGAASEGIDETSVCESWDAAYLKIKSFLENDIDVILEKQIIGTYHTSPILNNFQSHLALPCIKEVSDKKHGIVTNEQKRMRKTGLTRTVLLDALLQEKLQKLSLKMFRLVQPLDYTRFDYIVEKTTSIPYFIEFNVCCNLGEHSTINQAANHVGIKYDKLLENVVFSSMWRQNLLDDIGGYKMQRIHVPVNETTGKI